MIDRHLHKLVEIEYGEPDWAAYEMLCGHSVDHPEMHDTYFWMEGDFVYNNKTGDSPHIDDWVKEVAIFPEGWDRYIGELHVSDNPTSTINKEEK